jgi:hypothetical protein
MGCTSPNAEPAGPLASTAPANGIDLSCGTTRTPGPRLWSVQARSFGRYGYKRITGLLQMAGWNVNVKRVQRIWRAEGLKLPKRQPKRGRLWLNDGSCIRLRPEHKNHVWAYDFVAEKTHDGRAPKLLTVVDEYTRRVPRDRGRQKDHQPRGADDARRSVPRVRRATLALGYSALLLLTPRRRSHSPARTGCHPCAGR